MVVVVVFGVVAVVVSLEPHYLPAWNCLHLADNVVAAAAAAVADVGCIVVVAAAAADDVVCANCALAAATAVVVEETKPDLPSHDVVMSSKKMISLLN